MSHPFTGTSSHSSKQLLGVVVEVLIVVVDAVVVVDIVVVVDAVVVVAFHS